MKKFGLIVATIEEITALLNKSGSLEEIEDKPFAIYRNKIGDKVLYIIHSNCGQEFASIATTYLINKYNIEYLFNYGIVGSINPKLNKYDTCIVEKAVQYDFDTDPVDHLGVGYHDEFKQKYFYCNQELIEKALKIVDLPLLSLCSGNRFIADNQTREYLYRNFNCDIVDMELIGILISAKLFNVPVLSIKGISDSYDDDGNTYNEMAYKSALNTVEIIKKIIEEI